MRKGWSYDQTRGLWSNDATDACVVKDDPLREEPPPGHRWAAWWTLHGARPDGYYRTARAAMQACEQAKEAGDGNG
jgi:hypothetical protein